MLTPFGERLLELASRKGYKNALKLAEALKETKHYSSKKTKSVYSYLQQVLNGKRNLVGGLREALKELIPDIDSLETPNQDNERINAMNVLMQSYVLDIRNQFQSLETEQERLYALSKLETFVKEVSIKSR